MSRENEDFDGDDDDFDLDELLDDQVEVGQNPVYIAAFLLLCYSAEQYRHLPFHSLMCSRSLPTGNPLPRPNRKPGHELWGLGRKVDNSAGYPCRNQGGSSDAFAPGRARPPPRRGLGGAAVHRRAPEGPIHGNSDAEHQRHSGDVDYSKAKYS